MARKLSLTKSTATGTVQQAEVKKRRRPKKNVQQVQPYVGQDNNSGDFGSAPAENAGPSAVVQKKKQVEKLSTVISEAGPSNAQKKGRKKGNSAPLSSKKRQCKAPVRKTVGKKKIGLPSQILNSDSSDPDSDEEDAECQFCEHKYSKDQHGEHWILYTQTRHFYLPFESLSTFFAQFDAILQQGKKKGVGIWQPYPTRKMNCLSPLVLSKL